MARAGTAAPFARPIPRSGFCSGRRIRRCCPEEILAGFGDGAEVPVGKRKPCPAGLGFEQVLRLGFDLADTPHQRIAAAGYVQDDEHVPEQLAALCPRYRVLHFAWLPGRDAGHLPCRHGGWIQQQRRRGVPQDLPDPVRGREDQRGGRGTNRLPRDLTLDDPGSPSQRITNAEYLQRLGELTYRASACLSQRRAT